jgi:hypothetical protein
MAVIPPSIRAAFAEANARWPIRSRASDGSVGDAAHSARASDHNPDARGVVHAFDLTHDPTRGVDCNALANQVLADPRVKYVIWNHRINSRDGRGWRSYSGSNPHTHHMHVSIHAGAAENDTRPWFGTSALQGDDAEVISQEAKSWFDARFKDRDRNADLNMKEHTAEVKNVLWKSRNVDTAFELLPRKADGTPDLSKVAGLPPKLRADLSDHLKAVGAL